MHNISKIMTVLSFFYCHISFFCSSCHPHKSALGTTFLSSNTTATDSFHHQLLQLLPILFIISYYNCYRFFSSSVITTATDSFHHQLLQLLPILFIISDNYNCYRFFSSSVIITTATDSFHHQLYLYRLPILFIISYNICVSDTFYQHL